MNKKLVDQLSKELTDLEKATKRDNLYSATSVIILVVVMWALIIRVACICFNI